MSQKILEIAARYSARIKDKYIFFSPNIPLKKLQNAMSSYATGVGAGSVIALIDNTCFGGAKDGALLTTTTLYVHNIAMAPQQIDLAEIESINFVQALTSVLHINDIPLLQINFPEKAAMVTFVHMLRDMVAALRPAPAAPAAPAKSPVEALKELKALFDSGVLTQEEYEAKRKVYVDQL